jgi:4-amino-4-deoxy-L-arabinose transferase-like glycosyltransferase
MNNKIKLYLILVLGLFFLIFGYRYSFSWAHDHDLYSWIAKDIVLNGHWRLVGQITSVDGVFIGPLYYYMIAFAYWIFGMNPLSSILVTTIIGLVSIGAIYFFVKEFWGEKKALIIAFLVASSTGIALFQRWSVPTQPTILWSILFLYVILKSIKGDKRILYLYGLLIGLTYHIHIALLPILPLPIVAYLLSGKGNIIKNFKKIKLKEYIIFFLIFLVTSSPFWLFEIKHNWSQVTSIISTMQSEYIGPTGWQKFNKVIDASSKEIQFRLLHGWDSFPIIIIWPTVVLMAFYLLKKKILDKKQLTYMFVWVFMIMLAQFTSKKVVSEYYFTNLIPIVFLITSLFFIEIIKNKSMLTFLAIIYCGLNFLVLINNFNYTNSESYDIKDKVTNYIVNDARENNYPCISINYIASPGNGVGFRYLFWYKGMKVVKTNPSIPQYDIVAPFDISVDSLDKRFSGIGVIKPKEIKNINPSLCENPDLELDPLLGYTE